MSHVTVYIDGQVCSPETIKAWEDKRVEVVSRQLHEALGTPEVKTAEELADLKMTIPDEKLRAMCAEKCKKSDKSSAFLEKLSRGKSKNCVVELDIEGARAQEMKD